MIAERGESLRIASLFSGCGGLDLGFEQAGFDIVWANEFDKKIWATHERNFPNAKLVRGSITDVDPSELPQVDGFIGGPPCQSWSEAGAHRGINDSRGRLFYDYVRLIEAKKPLFFLAENVSGMLFQRHSGALSNIIESFREIGYFVNYWLLNAKDYGVPQDRKRVIIIGYREDTELRFFPPDKINRGRTLKDAIWDLRESAKPAKKRNHANTSKLKVPNHEYMIGGFSPLYLSRNRVRSWDEPSFTIQAGGRHAPIHPQAPKMVSVGKDKKEFEKGSEKLYRRLSVRECARVQTFPDDFFFVYQNVADAYKMIGNAVPVEFAKQLALHVKGDLSQASCLAQVTEAEVCLSLPDQVFEITRKKRCKIKCQDMQGNWRTFKVKGFTARVIQHETDHLNGILIDDEHHRNTTEVP